MTGVEMERGPPPFCNSAPLNAACCVEEQWLHSWKWWWVDGWVESPPPFLLHPHPLLSEQTDDCPRSHLASVHLV